MRSTSLVETASSLLAQITVDLADCVDSSWALALAKVGTGYLPLYTFGHHPNLEWCVAALEGRAVDDGKLPADWSPRITCPVQGHGGLSALLAFGPRCDGGEYTAKDRSLIFRAAAHVSFLLSEERMAAKVGIEMARLQRLTEEMASAREVQDRLFPSAMPAVKGLDYYGECHPTDEVGGDLFDFVPAGNSSLLVSIGDVSGKGVPAALIMAGIQATLRVLSSIAGGRISNLMQDLNRMVWRLCPERFYATLFYARVDSARQELNYVNAGHDRAMLLRDNGSRVLNLETTGTVLGLSTKTVYQQRTIPLEPGDVFVAVTDGITEARSRGGEVLDEQVVLEAVRDRPDAPASELAASILSAVDSFTGGADQEDDRTVVVVRVAPALASEKVRRAEHAMELCPTGTY
ncbi:MAG: PP2C family protein-serine/threonine phosphatase [Bryobacteraceae bacterium]